MFLYSSSFDTERIILYYKHYVVLFYEGFKMLDDNGKQKRIKQAAERALQEAQQRRETTEVKILPKEINGRKGKEPTRFDDWERKGIAYDF
jgi:hypothetical protein